MLIGNPKKLVLVLEKECSNKTDELARKKGKQAESKVPIVHSFSVGVPSEDGTHIEGRFLLLQMILSRKFLVGVCPGLHCN